MTLAWVAVYSNYVAFVMFCVCLIQTRNIVFEASLIIFALYQHVHMLYAVMTLYVHLTCNTQQLRTQAARRDIDMLPEINNRAFITSCGWHFLSGKRAHWSKASQVIRYKRMRGLVHVTRGTQGPPLMSC